MLKKFIMMPAIFLLASLSVKAVVNESVFQVDENNVFQTTEQDTDTESSAVALLHAYQHAFKHSLYELSYIEVKQGHIESIRYIHGVVDGNQLSHKMFLNGPANEAVARDDKIAYFEPGQVPYSLRSAKFSGVFHNLAAIDIEQFNQNYDLVIAGKSRVAGHPAQVIRIVPKSTDLFGLYLWIDNSSQLPLRVDIVDKAGDLVEQHMVVSLIEFDEPTEWMRELARLDLPSAVAGQALDDQESLAINWTLGWQPEGMEVMSQERHSLVLLSESVDYLKLSDGLFDISVYANQIGNSSPYREQLIHQGATSLHTIVHNGIELTVVGEIPAETAAKIANAVIFESK